MEVLVKQKALPFNAILQIVILQIQHYYNMSICPNATKIYVGKCVEIQNPNDTKRQMHVEN